MCNLLGDKVTYPKAPDVYRFDKDNNAALSPEQPASWETPSSTSASPSESGGSEADSNSSQFNSPVQVRQYLQLLWSIYKMLHVKPFDRLSRLHFTDNPWSVIK